MKRKIFLASSLSAALAGCSAVGTKLNGNARFHDLLGAVEPLDRTLIGTHGLAREYPASAISAHFPMNSLPTPMDAYYMQVVNNGYRPFSLRVDGAVERPMTLSYAALQKVARQQQITRHDCVEGWSAIAAWSGPRLSDVLALVKPRPDARYVIFHCMDRDDQGLPYYESLDLRQASHPQTLLATGMNGKPVPPEHGGPVRLRVPTQLGYKSAKWVRHIEVVGTFAQVGGAGGYWEDQGYEWYAGI
ncbi:MAG: molybdopterin-dependent oxidoreductase [Candidatus Eremiobacteraeota bacterium]|nr:molybdopterin-dependent oxidoreductase [Candidatus Eremiobacteraeota bacterium]